MIGSKDDMEPATSQLTAELQTQGFYILGHFPVAGDETLVADLDRQPKTVALIGNVGSSIWPFFSDARKNRVGLSLDQWTEDVIGAVARKFGNRVVYPFEGPPFHPFTRWAIRTGTLFPSPIGLTIHPTFGLWHAFRAALLFNDKVDFDDLDIESPCVSCTTRACLSTCPVDAFGEDGYQFKACLNYLAGNRNTCRSNGCDARKACPIGRAFHYEPDHAAFHMEQLLKAHGQA